MGTPVYMKLAREIERAQRGEREMAPFAADAREAIEQIESDCLPYGSGFDSGCRVELEQSSPNKIVILCEFHHMNDVGMYDGWTTHRVILTPCLRFGFAMRITGRDKRGIKEYIGDVMHAALSSEESI